jgi:hypothetical protein
METVPTTPDRERPPAAPSEPPSTPRRRRRWPWAIGVIAGALAIVISVIALMGGRAGDTSAGSSPTVVPAPPPPAPKHLTAIAASFHVALKWRPATGDPPTDQEYAVYRDGDYVGSAMNGDLRYVDKTALPSQRYRYTVRAVGFGSASMPAFVVVTTPEAPLSVARLQGTFNMKFHITSSYGVNGFGNKTEGWRYAPDCDEGACTTHVIDIHTKGFATDLHRSGGTYKATFSMRGYIYCHSTPSNTSVSITLHVTKAQAYHDAFRATDVAGTMSVSASGQLGCRSGGITYRVTGSLPGA